MLISQTITDALIELGVVNPIDEATPQDHEYGLRTLNRIIDSYNTQGILVTYIEDLTIQAPYVLNECSVTPEELVAGGRAWKNVITIGHCQDVNQEAPIEIQEVFWRQGTSDYESKPMTLNQWSSIPYKSNVAIPRRHFIQRTNDNNIKLYFDYIPSDDLELHILAKQPYTGKNSVGNEYLPTDDINWNYGFEKMLMARLAIELAPSYETEPSAALVAKAIEAEDVVKSNNFQPRTLKRRASYGRTRRYRNNYLKV